MTARTLALDDLAERLAADTDGAFPELVTAMKDPIFSGVYRMLGSWHDAEEVTQDAFVRAFGALHRYPAEQVRTLRLRAWLWTIALNLCRNRVRTRGRRPVTTPLEAGPEPAGRDTTEATALDAVDETWNRRLGELSHPMRSAVVLRHVVGLDYEEIAAALDRPVGTVKSDVHRGLDKLRTILVAEGATP
jgi:RNA polymerase sigma-70 factor (ECF subfamily)